MEIFYTNHFWKQLAQRSRTSPVELTIELVESTVLDPDFVMDDPKYPEREWRVKRIAGRCLKVIVEDRGERVIVVTVMFDRTLRRKGLCG